MKIGEVWINRYKEIHHVKIREIVEERYYHVTDKDNWIVFDYCDENGVLGPDEYTHGDTLLRYRFVKEYSKVYK